MKTITLIMLLLFSHLLYADDIYIDTKGALQIKGKNIWGFKDFKKYGYKIFVDYEVYLSEGVLSDSKDNYNVSIRNNKPAIYFEVIGNKLWRGNLISPKIPIYTNISNEYFYLGMTLKQAINTFGKYKNLGSGHDIGSYLTFENISNASFHTMCSLDPFEQTEKEKKMNTQQHSNYCKIDTMMFFGNEGVVVTNEI